MDDQLLRSACPLESLNQGVYIRPMAQKPLQRSKPIGMAATMLQHLVAISVPGSPILRVLGEHSLEYILCKGSTADGGGGEKTLW